MLMCEKIILLTALNVAKMFIKEQRILKKTHGYTKVKIHDKGSADR